MFRTKVTSSVRQMLENVEFNHKKGVNGRAGKTARWA
jgi:hypothetical protein